MAVIYTYLQRLILGILLLSHPLLAEEMVRTGTIENEEITEASGLAASTLADSLLWILNDSGNQPCLYALRPDGSDLGKITIAQTSNDDWEDLVSYRLNKVSYLLIADVGDNRSRRQVCHLYIIREPRVQENGFFNQTVDVYKQIDFTYENGPRDCEAVAVDPVQQKIILLSKNPDNSRVFELPLTPSSQQPLQAKQIGTATAVSQVTAMDIAVYNLAGVVMNYQNLFIFYRRIQEKWGDVFALEPVVVPIPPLPGAEAACFDKSGTLIYLTSETRHAPIYRFTTIDAPVDSIPPYPPENVRLIDKAQ